MLEKSFNALTTCGRRALPSLVVFAILLALTTGFAGLLFLLAGPQQDARLVTAHSYTMRHVSAPKTRPPCGKPWSEDILLCRYTAHALPTF